MKKLKEKVLKIIILLTVVSSTLPFFCHDVYADTLSQSDIQGVERVLVNSTYLDQSVTNSGNTYKYYSFDYEVTVLLKDYYLGWIQGTFQTSYKTFDNANWQVQNSSCTTVSKSYYVNNNKFSTSFTVTAWIMVNQQGNVDPAGSYTTSFTLSNSNVVAYQDLNSIDTVIDILQDVSQYVSVDILDELQNIVDELQLSNDYLETISKLRQYYFPTESLSALTRAVDPYQIRLGNTELLDFAFGRWLYPLVKITHNDNDWIIFQNIIYKDHPIDIVFWAQSTRSASTWQNDFRIGTPADFEILKVERLQYTNILGLDGDETNNAKGFGLFHFQIAYIGNSTASQFYFYAIKNPIYYVPIFCGLADNVSTDFALEYNLENQVLRNLNIIAQGTNQSNSSASSLDDNASDFDDVAGDVYNLENSFNIGLNNSLQQIDTSFDVGNTFGSKFLLAADWVRVQFNTITASNPFGTILSFSLLLGVALLIIGKVLG